MIWKRCLLAMSSFSELIEWTCPEGVLRVPLGDLITIKNGKDHKPLSDGDIPVYGSGGIMRYANESIFDGPSVLIPRKGSLGNIFYVDEPFWVVDTIFYTQIDEDRLSPKFFYYALQSLEIERMNQAGGVPSQTQTRLKKVLIPLPPLEVQQEIVRILDLFVDLDREIELEIIGRERQKIATSHALFEQLKDYPHITLKDAGTWFGGGTPSKKNESFWQNGTIAWVSPKDMHDHTVTRTIDYITNEAVEGSSTKLVPAGSTALVARSSILEKKLPVAYFPQEVAMNQDLKAVFPSDELNGRYLFNALEEYRESILLRARNTGGSAASLDTKRLMVFEIPLPPLEVQEEITQKLDMFIEYIDNLKRERELRQKQYAHYRNLLLDLPVKE